MKVYAWEKLHEDAVRAADEDKPARIATARIAFFARRKELEAQKTIPHSDELVRLDEASRRLDKMSDGLTVQSGIPSPAPPRAPLNYSKIQR